MTSMRISIPYNASGIGGPMTFARLLSEALKKDGYTVTHQPTLQCDVVLVFSEAPLFFLWQAKQRGIRIVQRLDGLYHPGLPGKNGYLYFFKNLRARLIHRYLADAVIYQSEFSKKSVKAMWGWLHPDHKIIYNGTPQDVLKTEKNIHSPVRLFAHARWRREDQLDPVVRAMRALPSNYELTVIGPVTSNLATLQRQLMTTPRVSWLPSATTAELRTFLQDQDIFLFADQSACPNSVLEALASHVPVVAFDRGAISELLEPGRTGEVVPLTPHNPFRENYRFSDSDIKRYAESIEHVAAMYPTYQQNLTPATLAAFDLKTSTNQYEEILRPNA